MTDTAALLIVDHDEPSVRLLASEARARGYCVRTASSVEDGLALLAGAPVDVLLVDLAPAAERALDLLSRLAPVTADSEVLVMSRDSSIAVTLQWFDAEAFAFVPKDDVVQVFAALARSLERRKMTRQNRRLVWELQTLNDVSAGIARSLDLDDVLSGAVRSLIAAMNVTGGSIRLRSRETGEFELCTVVGPPALQRLWASDVMRGRRPSDQVIATRQGVVVEDFCDLPAYGALDLASIVRSAVSVPLLAGDELIGTLSLGAATPGRFGQADLRLLSTIACQLVVVLHNVRLHQTVRVGKMEWESTFDAISDPIGVFNGRGELLRGNQALAAHLSLPVTGMRQLTCEEIGFCAPHRSRAGEEPECFVHERSQHEVTLPDGRIFSVTSFPIRTSQHGAAVVQVAKNVTEDIENARRLEQMRRELTATNERLITALNTVKSTQAQLVQAEKLSAMGQLVAGVAHELNNPLTTVIGYAQLVEEDLGTDPLERPLAAIAADVRRIAGESERAARIVKNLLAFARQQGTARAPQDLAAICERTLALRSYEFRLRNIELHLAIDPALPPILVDPGQLQQVLLNLVLNAEQAMRHSPVRRLTITGAVDDACGAVRLSVADTGHGVEGAHLSRLFDPFFTTRPVGEGTGLGLSICYGIVREHGGVVSVDSTPGDGTVFHVVLPMRQPDTGGVRALVALGDRSDREFVAAALDGWGYRTSTVSTLGDAEAVLARAGADMVLVDGASAERPTEWTALRTSSGVRPIVISSPRDGAAGWPGHDEVAVLARPVGLQALLAAVRGCAKECV